MVNLWCETVQFLIDNGKTTSDIVFITDGCNCRLTDPKDLQQLLNLNYDNGYGLAEVNPELKLVGKDFWLERSVYDGAEKWEFKTMPKYIKTNFKSIMVSR